MTNEEATSEIKKLFGEDSFAEQDDQVPGRRYYVGRCPTLAGGYYGFMGYSWEEALGHARNAAGEPTPAPHRD